MANQDLSLEDIFLNGSGNPILDYSPKPEEPGLLKQIGTHLNIGAQKYAALPIAGLTQMAGDTLGIDGMSQAGKNMQANTEAYLSDLEKQAPTQKFQDIDSVGKAGKYVLQQMAEYVPQGILMLGTGGLGGGAARIAGGAALKSGLATAENIAGRAALESAAEKIAAGELTKEAAQKALTNAALDKIGLKGAQAANALGSIGMETSTIYQGQPEGQKDPGRASLYGFLAGLLDTAVPNYMMQKTGAYKLIPGMKSAADEANILASHPENLTFGQKVKDIAKVAGEGMGEESAQEAVQTILERIGSNDKLQSDEAKKNGFWNTVASKGLKAAVDPEAWDDIIESSAAGGTIGTVMGGGSSAVGHMLSHSTSPTVADNAQQVSVTPGQHADTTTGSAGASPAPGGAVDTGNIQTFDQPVVARDAVSAIAGGNQYQQFAEQPFANAPAQPAIAGPAVEGMLDNLQPIDANGRKNSLSSAILAGDKNEYQQFAEQPFANAPAQPAIAGPAVEGMLDNLQPATPSERFQALQWANQQLQDPSLSKFERQNLTSMVNSSDTNNQDLIRQWRRSTNQSKQQETTTELPSQQEVSAPVAPSVASTIPALQQQPRDVHAVQSKIDSLIDQIKQGKQTPESAFAELYAMPEYKSLSLYPQQQGNIAVGIDGDAEDHIYQQFEKAAQGEQSQASQEKQQKPAAEIPSQQGVMQENDLQQGEATKIGTQQVAASDNAALSQPEGGVEHGEEGRRRQEALTGTPDGSVKTVYPATKRNRSVNPAQDDMITAIGKLGGLNRDQAIAQWGNNIKDSIADLNRHASREGKFGFLHVVSSKGKDLDSMREALEEHGYLPDGSTIEDMYAKIDKFLSSGMPTYSNQYEWADHDALMAEEENRRLQEMIDMGEIPFSLRALRDGSKYQEDHLKVIGQAFMSPDIKYTAWLKRMKQTLGDLFDSVKKLMIKTFQSLKQAYREKAPAFMSDQKGKIQLSLFDLPEAAKKEAFELRGERWTQGDKKPVQQGLFDEHKQEKADKVNTPTLNEDNKTKTEKTNSVSETTPAPTLTKDQKTGDTSAPQFKGEEEYPGNPESTNTQTEEEKQDTVKPEEKQDTTANPTKPGLVTDAGEELKYNKRNRVKGIKWADVQDANDALKAKWVQKNNVYPKPDYQALVDDGMKPLIAHLIKQVYDAIPVAPVTRSTPTDADFKLYITAVNRVMDGAFNWASNPAAVAAWAMKQARIAGAMGGQRVELSDLHNVTSLYDTVYPGGWRKFADEVRILGGNTLLSRLQPGYDEARRAVKDIEKGWPGKIEAWQRQGMSIGSKADVSIKEQEQPSGKMLYVIDYGKHDYLKTFDSRADAEAFLGGLGDFLLLDKYKGLISSYTTREEAVAAAKAKSVKEKEAGPVERGINVSDAERIGPQRRMPGQDVSSKELMDAFGFRGVNFGNWVPQDERQLHLNHLYDSLFDMAELLGVPPKAVSLNGMLGIAVGAQGSGKASAHFVPGLNEINVTRTAGAGALAHEWGHAVDHYFGNLAGFGAGTAPYLSYHLKNGTTGTVRPEILQAFKNIMTAMKDSKETPEQVVERVERYEKRATSDFEKNLARMDENFKSAPEEVRKEAQALIDKLRKKQFGDGYVAISSKAAVFPVIADMYQLSRKNKLNLPIDDFIRMQSAAFSMDILHDADIHQPQRTSTKYYTNAKVLDLDKKKPYWSTPEEMFARAFDAYLTNRLYEQERKNSYLSGITDDVLTSPKDADLTAISRAFDTLLGELKTKDTEKGVALYSLAHPTTTGLNAADLQKEFNDLPFSSKIKVVQTAEELPGFDSKSHLSNQVEGQYKDGTIYLVADNLPSVERARIVALRHELTHAGQSEKVTDMAVAWFRDAMAKGENGSKIQQAATQILNEEADKRGYNLTKDADFRKAVQEATAVIAEKANNTGDKAGLMTRMLMYLKHFLRTKLGWKTLPFTDKELVSTVSMMMQQGEQNLTNGKGPDGEQFANKPQYSLASKVSSAISGVDWKAAAGNVQENWKHIINPLDWSRAARWFDDWTPESIKSAFGYMLAVPHFQAERDAAKRPFVDASENREIDRMDMMLQFLGYNPGQKDTRSLKEKTWDFLTKWESGQHQTDWEKMNQRRANLPVDQQKALDALFVEGDVSGASYSSLEKALTNPRIARTNPSAETFALYRDIRNHMDNHVAKIREQRMEQMMREAGVDEGTIKAHIADYRNDLRETGGWMPRNHGDGEHATIVHHVVNDLKFGVREVKDGKQQAYLPYFPGNAVLTRLEDLAKQTGNKIKVTPRGAIIVTGDQVHGFIDEASKIIPEIGPQKVMVYSRYNQTKGAARNQADLINKDLKAAIPHNFLPNEQYEVITRQVDKLSESMYQNMRSDMAVEALLMQSAQRALKRGDMSKEQYNEFVKDLAQNTAEVLLGRAAGKYQIRRAPYLIEGYDTDNAMSQYQDYMMGVAGMISKADYAAKQFENFRNAEIPVKQWATKYIFDSLRNQGLGDRISGNLRAFASLWYMGLRPASALINATQNYTLGWAELGRHIKKGSALALIGKANADIIKGKLAPDEEKLFESAIYRQQEMGSALSNITGHNESATSKASNLLHNITSKTLALFQNVEMMNRKTMILAAYRAFRSKDTPKGMIDQAAFEKSMEINNSVNFNMHRGNLPGWARNPVGHTLYALQSFTFNSFNWMFNRMTSGEKRDVKALLRYAGSIVAIAGVAALPGGDELDRLYRKLFGKSLNLEFQKFTHKNLKRFGNFGELADAFAWHGAAGAAGVNISNSLRLQIPVISQLLSGDDLSESAAGVFGGMLQKGSTAIKAASKGDVYRAVEAAAPEAISGPMRAYRQYNKGVTTMGGKHVYDENGQPLKYSAADAALRATGLQPMQQSKRTEVSQIGREIEEHWRENRQNVIDAIRLADTPAERQKTLKQVQEFNVDLRGSQAAGLVQPITMNTIRNAVLQRKSKADKNKVGWLQNYLQ